MVAPTQPGAAVGRGEQRLDLVEVEVGEARSLVAFEGDRDHPADRVKVLGVAQGGVLVERVDRRQPGVAGAGAVAAVCLEVVEERADQLRVEVVDVQLARLLAGLLGGEREQQPEGGEVGRRRGALAGPFPTPPSRTRRDRFRSPGSPATIP